MKINHEARLRLLNLLAAGADLALLNLCLAAALTLLPALLSRHSTDNPSAMFASWNLAYLIGMVILPIRRISFVPCLRTGLVIVLLHHAAIHCLGLPAPSVWQFTLSCLVLPGWLLASRLLSRALLRAFADRRTVALVGEGEEIRQLRRTMTLDRTARTTIVGTYASPADAIGTKAEELYCSSAFDTSEIERLSDYCENNIVRLYLVPEIHALKGRRLAMTSDGGVPLVVMRPEPLRSLSAQILKRTFDIVFSAIFLVTVFPIAFLIIAPLIKRASPGPVFFSQRRNGLDGRDFQCLKFRTMRNDPSCDGKAATERDVRKFPFGDFLRRHNLDELPQFINVLKGEMSVVGPRPHATWTTDAYRDLVKCYMLRLYAKPGITGWAQVNGCRGETRTTDDMVRRIHLDIWYIGHWSFALDMRIIFLTIRNMLLGEKGNAY